MTIREAGKENVLPYKTTYRVGFTAARRRDCISCDWCKSLEDSRGNAFWFCMDAQGGSYLEETWIGGHCTTEETEDETELTAENMDELEELWESLTEKLGTTEDSVKPHTTKVACFP